MAFFVRNIKLRNFSAISIIINTFKFIHFTRLKYSLICNFHIISELSSTKVLKIFFSSFSSKNIACFFIHINFNVASTLCCE